MSVTRTLMPTQLLGVGTFPNVVDVDSFSRFTAQWVAPSGTAVATAEVFVSVLRADDPRLADQDPATNPRWELLATEWVAPLTPLVTAASAGTPLNQWQTANFVITVDSGTITDFELHAYLGQDPT